MVPNKHIKVIYRKRGLLTRKTLYAFPVELYGPVCYNTIAAQAAPYDLRGGSILNIELSEKEFRRLLDLVYVGNWILNSARGDDRFEDYDLLQEKMFALAPAHGMSALVQRWYGHVFPSQAYEDGGIHEAIADYEDAVFYDILAEELARRDMSDEQISQNDTEELAERMEEYYDEFEENGIDNVRVAP